MEATTATRLGEVDSPAQVLAFAREQRETADRAEADLLRAAVDLAGIYFGIGLTDRDHGGRPKRTAHVRASASGHHNPGHR